MRQDKDKDGRSPASQGRAASPSGLSPSGSSLSGIPSACRNCADGGWVCENHQDRPWDGTSADAGACGCGAGAPCPVCSRELACAPYMVSNGYGWDRQNPPPRDATVLVTVVPTEANSAFRTRPPDTVPAYVDELGRYCDCGTWKPDKGLHGDFWQVIAWMPLPHAASRIEARQGGDANAAPSRSDESLTAEGGDAQSGDQP